ncbi:MAG TPA: sigma-70 family RNA polymerase sigma factor [Jiangellaceae bacterium]|nr:sigma-70 family RNA polymerase sigma factor [Jiangellaceae bacterium]
MSGQRIEDLLRELAPQVLGAVARHFGDFDAAEDAVQEALLTAAQQWPESGVPESPRGWLIRVASRRMTDYLRSEESRRRREVLAAATVPADTQLAPAPDEVGHQQDDSLTVLFMCCHPVLTRASAIALTLRAVGGLTTAEIANAFLVPEATMAQRISRAKQRIKSSEAPFTMPDERERGGRLASVLHVLYLIFNEGYTATSGDALQRTDLTAEAIRLTRMVHAMLAHEGEVAGLLALMLLTDARRAARTDEAGFLVPLPEQRRELWNQAQIAAGTELLTRTLGAGPVGPYQIQAAIAAVHDEAPSAAETDWPQILALYETLEQVAPGPMVTLNRAVAVAMVHGPRAGLAVLGTLEDDKRMARSHRLEATRGHLLELAGDIDGARECYQRAARVTASRPEQHYLSLRAARLG